MDKQLYSANDPSTSCTNMVNFGTVTTDIEVWEIFKNRLDKHWLNHEVLCDFNADLTGSGSVPICMWTWLQDAGKEGSTCARDTSLDWNGLDLMK